MTRFSGIRRLISSQQNPFTKVPSELKGLPLLHLQTACFPNQSQTIALTKVQSQYMIRHIVKANRPRLVGIFQDCPNTVFENNQELAISWPVTSRVHETTEWSAYRVGTLAEFDVRTGTSVFENPTVRVTCRGLDRIRIIDHARHFFGYWEADVETFKDDSIRECDKSYVDQQRKKLEELIQAYGTHALINDQNSLLQFERRLAFMKKQSHFDFSMWLAAQLHPDMSKDGEKAVLGQRMLEIRCIKQRYDLQLEAFNQKLDECLLATPTDRSEEFEPFHSAFYDEDP